LVKKWKRRDSPKEIPPLISAVFIMGDNFRPIITAGRAKKRPARGPAAPISKSARRLGIGDLILMKAPKVPIRGLGIGRK